MALACNTLKGLEK